MIRRWTCMLIIAGAVVGGLWGTASAQLEPNLGALTNENVKGYLNPLTGALSATMNSAVFTSGHVPRTGINFEIGARVMGVSFDSADRKYTPTNPPGFEDVEQVSAPTVIGDTKAVTLVGGATQQITYPGGFDMDSFTIAVPQVTIGSVMGTRAVVRWIAVKFGDADLGKFNLFGIGAQHSISQYFPTLPVDLAIGGLYQNFKIGDDLVKTNAVHLDVTGSKRFGVLEPYAAIGLDSFGMKVKFTENAGTSAEQTVNVKFDNKMDPHFTLGARANLAVVSIHAELDLAAETGMAVGLSFGK